LISSFESTCDRFLTKCVGHHQATILNWQDLSGNVVETKEVIVEEPDEWVHIGGANII